MSDRIQITSEDLQTEKVQEYLTLQQNLRQDFGQLEQVTGISRVLFSSWFYLSIASGLGGFVAWMIMEPFIDDRHLHDPHGNLAGMLTFPVVAACIGLFLGAAEGVMCRNIPRALISAAVGFGVGFGGGLVASFGANIFFAIAVGFAVGLSKHAEQGNISVSGWIAVMIGRGAAWAIAGIPAGLGQGIAQREKKVILNGALGGLLGGLVGGLVFDPISWATTTADGQAIASRCVGFITIGLSVGLFVGLVEGWTKTAWLLMRQGPLAGKQFIMFRDTTMLGSSPKAEIYLFKDAAIEPQHAKIYNRGGRFEIEDCGTPEGTYVNGIPIQREWLKSGDQIVLGKTVLEFIIKETS